MDCRTPSTLVVILLLWPWEGQAECAIPFRSVSGRCLYNNSIQAYSWCTANLECASLKGELANAYSAVKGQPSSQILWIGVSDLADERVSLRSGWQQINDNGVLPYDASIWFNIDPDMESQYCLVIFNSASPGSLMNKECSLGNLGYLCEFKPANQSATKPQSVAWKRVSFKRTSYNPSSEYCFKDLTGMPSALSCVAAAGRDANCRRALYNKRTQLCRLLLFTDAQVESEIENSEDWSKFSFV